MTHVNDRQSIQILCIWLSWNYMVVIRNKLGMHPRLLTDRHDGFQLGKLINAESDRNLIVSVGAEQILEHRNAADHRNAPVGILCALVIIENTVNKIAPFRMNAETVDVALCSTAVADQKDMLQILACFTHLAEDLVDCHTEQEVNTQIHDRKDTQKKTGVVLLFNKEKDGNTVNDTKQICLDQIKKLGSAAGSSFRIV